MKTPKNIDVLFVAGFGPIVRDPAASRKFYSDALGLSFKEETNGYLHTDGLDGGSNDSCNFEDRIAPPLKTAGFVCVGVGGTANREIRVPRGR